MRDALPNSIEIRGRTFNRIGYFSRIWTQAESRSFGLYWSRAERRGCLHPSPTDEELAKFYDTSSYDTYLSGGVQKSGPKQHSLAERAVINLAWRADRGADDALASILHCARQYRNPQSVCDIGCGGGELLARLRDATGANSVGVDPSEVSGRAVIERGIEFHRGGADVLPSSLEGRTFDLVTMHHSLEHCRDPDRAIANAASLLEPTGLLVVDVPNMDCAGFRMYREVWYHTDAGRHLHFFTPLSLTAMVKAAGLEPVRIEFYGYTRQFLPSWTNAMARLWDTLFADTEAPTPPRPNFARSLLLLAGTMLAPKRVKYDSMRLFARHHH